LTNLARFPSYPQSVFLIKGKKEDGVKNSFAGFFRFGIFLLAGWAAANHSPALAKGKVKDGIYTSPRELFSVKVPKSTNWVGIPFTFKDVSKKDKTNFDLVEFVVPDFGEFYVASVRHIPPAVLEEMAKDEPQNALKNVSLKALLDWRRDFPEEPQVVEDSFITTPYGPGILRLFNTANASSGQKLTLESGKMVAKRYDVLIAVILVIRDNHYISAIAENDNGFKEGQNAGRLKEGLLSFFSELKVLESPPFDKRK
jgi:hypothetical protein